MIDSWSSLRSLQCTYLSFSNSHLIHLLEFRELCKHAQSLHPLHKTCSTIINNHREFSHWHPSYSTVLHRIFVVSITKLAPPIRISRDHKVTNLLQDGRTGTRAEYRSEKGGMPRARRQTSSSQRKTRLAQSAECQAGG